MIAEIAVSAATFAIDKPYSYLVSLTMKVCVGARVIVPFGRGNRKVDGVVISLKDSTDTKGLKPIMEVLDREPLISPTMLQMAAFIRQRCFCTLYEALRAMLPAGIWFKSRDIYRLTEDRSWKENPPASEDALRLLNALEDVGGAARSIELSRRVDSDEAYSKAIAYLLRKKWIESQVDFQQKVTDKSEKVATLAVSAEEALEFASHRPSSAKMQKSVMELMASVGSASVKEICYYTGATAATITRLAGLGLLELTERTVLRCKQIQPAKISGKLELTEEQQAAFAGLSQQMDQPKPGAALLYGITGSGKTAVYIKLIQRCLDQGKQAVLLVPEIALTPQLLSLMAAWFGDRVAVLHSSLAATERYDQWKRVRSGDAQVVVGTRSAVFAPCCRLGLMILDEEQEHSYKSENSPRYNAKEVALWRGVKEGALVLYGSATPSIESMYHAKMGHMSLYTLTKRFNQKALPQVQLVDMRKELELGNDLSFSLPLQEAIRHAADEGNQSILFLNRRGNARAMVCVDCRKSPECPRCEARLTYHSANRRLMCHYCGYSEAAPQRCPQCGGPVKTVGTGTQKVQQELQDVFSDLQVLRMDADTVSAVNTHEKILNRFREEKIPILLGTQMVAKGLDMPSVTLVGVLDADLSLYNESFRAAETTFNMLTQVVGRAGRGQSEGSAIIQTMVPNHRVMELAARQDYDGFYEMELAMRRVQNLPPFADLVTVTLSGRMEGQLLHSGTTLRQNLMQLLQHPAFEGQDCTVLGPAPCPVPKVNYNFRYRLTLRCKLDNPMRQLIAQCIRQFAQDGANRGVSIFADVNPYD